MQFSPAGRDDLCSGRNHPSFPTIKQLRHNNPALNKLQAAAKSPKKNPRETAAPQNRIREEQSGSNLLPKTSNQQSL